MQSQNIALEDMPGGPVVKTSPSIAGVRVWLRSPVEELGSHKPQGN